MASGAQPGGGAEGGAGGGAGGGRASLLIVIGDPASERQKLHVVDRVVRELQSWDPELAGCQIEAELVDLLSQQHQQHTAQLNAANHGVTDEDQIIRLTNDHLSLTILIDARVKTLQDHLHSELHSAHTRYLHLIHSGRTIQGDGDWLLRDGFFSFSDFSKVFHKEGVGHGGHGGHRGHGGHGGEVGHHHGKGHHRVIKLNCLAEGEWMDMHMKRLDIHMNPPHTSHANFDVALFHDYLASRVHYTDTSDLLQSSNASGTLNLKNQPTMYVFPAGQGSAAYFGVGGFSMLVDGGFNRKPGFWNLLKHLGKIDVLLVTHVGTDNARGLRSYLERMLLDEKSSPPAIGTVFFNCGRGYELPSHESMSSSERSLQFNVVEEAQWTADAFRRLGVEPEPCLMTSRGSGIQPVRLYHVVGLGALDMFVLSPIQECREIKEFLKQFREHASVGTFSTVGGIPLSSLVSVCAVLVWTPSSRDEKTTRILLPGALHQAKLMEALGKLKGIEMFRHAVYVEGQHSATQKAKSGIARPLDSKIIGLKDAANSSRFEAIMAGTMVATPISPSKSTTAVLPVLNSPPSTRQSVGVIAKKEPAAGKNAAAANAKTDAVDHHQQSSSIKDTSVASTRSVVSHKGAVTSSKQDTYSKESKATAAMATKTHAQPLAKEKQEPKKAAKPEKPTVAQTPKGKNAPGAVSSPTLSPPKLSKVATAAPQSQPAAIVSKASTAAKHAEKKLIHDNKNKEIVPKEVITERCQTNAALQNAAPMKESNDFEPGTIPELVVAAEPLVVTPIEIEPVAQNANKNMEQLAEIRDETIGGHENLAHPGDALMEEFDEALNQNQNPLVSAVPEQQDAVSAEPMNYAPETDRELFEHETGHFQHDAAAVDNVAFKETESVPIGINLVQDLAPRVAEYDEDDFMPMAGSHIGIPADTVETEMTSREMVIHGVVREAKAESNIIETKQKADENENEKDEILSQDEGNGSLSAETGTVSQDAENEVMNPEEEIDVLSQDDEHEMVNRLLQSEKSSDVEEVEDATHQNENEMLLTNHEESVPPPEDQADRKESLEEVQTVIFPPENVNPNNDQNTESTQEDADLRTKDEPDIHYKQTDLHSDIVNDVLSKPTEDIDNKREDDHLIFENEALQLDANGNDFLGGHIEDAPMVAEVAGVESVLSQCNAGHQNDFHMKNDHFAHESESLLSIGVSLDAPETIPDVMDAGKVSDFENGSNESLSPEVENLVPNSQIFSMQPTHKTDDLGGIQDEHSEAVLSSDADSSHSQGEYLLSKGSMNVECGAEFSVGHLLDDGDLPLDEDIAHPGKEDVCDDEEFGLKPEEPQCSSQNEAAEGKYQEQKEDTNLNDLCGKRKLAGEKEFMNEECRITDDIVAQDKVMEAERMSMALVIPNEQIIETEFDDQKLYPEEGADTECSDKSNGLNADIPYDDSSTGITDVNFSKDFSTIRSEEEMLSELRPTKESRTELHSYEILAEKSGGFDWGEDTQVSEVLSDVTEKPDGGIPCAESLTENESECVEFVTQSQATASDLELNNEAHTDEVPLISSLPIYHEQEEKLDEVTPMHPIEMNCQDVKKDFLEPDDVLYSKLTVEPIDGCLGVVSADELLPLFDTKKNKDMNVLETESTEPGLGKVHNSGSADVFECQEEQRDDICASLISTGVGTTTEEHSPLIDSKEKTINHENGELIKLQGDPINDDDGWIDDQLSVESKNSKEMVNVEPRDDCSVDINELLLASHCQDATEEVPPSDICDPFEQTMQKVLNSANNQHEQSVYDEEKESTSTQQNDAGIDLEKHAQQPWMQTSACETSAEPGKPNHSEETSSIKMPDILQELAMDRDNPNFSILSLTELEQTRASPSHLSPGVVDEDEHEPFGDLEAQNHRNDELLTDAHATGSIEDMHAGPTKEIFAHGDSLSSAISANSAANHETNSHHNETIHSSNITSDEPYDPVKEWGFPSELPMPNPETAKKLRAVATGAGGASDASKKTAADASAAKPSQAATAAKKPKPMEKPSTDPPPQKTTSSPKRPVAALKPNETQASNGFANDDKPKPDDKLRTGKPVGQRKAMEAPLSVALQKKGEAVHRPTGAQKPPPPCYYFDMAYVPGHGSANSADLEFFRQVRARHYILSCLEPDPQVLDALLLGKQSWNESVADLGEVTLVPTHDSAALHAWTEENAEDLERLKLNIAPAASRCKMEFSEHDLVSAFKVEL